MRGAAVGQKEVAKGRRSVLTGFASRFNHSDENSMEACPQPCGEARAAAVRAGGGVSVDSVLGGRDG